MKRLCAFLFAVLATASALHAQVVSDGQTNVLNSVTNSFGGTVTVGTNGDNTALILTNGTLLTNILDGVIGRNAGANTNYVWVTGSNTRWLMGLDLYVGNDGAFNRLVISNGALVANNNGYIGLNSGSSNNSVLVTGVGSVWTNSSSVVVGYSGAGNSLTIEGGGLVRADNISYLGYNSGSSNNVAIVTGAGSVWSNSGDVRVGNLGAGNTLLITNGGFVRNNYGSIGDGSTASNNVAVVTGAGSVWSNSSDLYVGASGDGNTLLITSGGLVRNNFAYLGYNSGANSNVAVVTGAGSTWSNGSSLLVGNFGAGNTLLITNGGFVRNTYGSIGDGSAASNNVAVVTGTGSAWSNSGDLYVGASGAGNRLIISNSGTVTVGIAGGSYSYLGFASTATNNLAVVTGTNSLWSAGYQLFVGYDGPRNQLIVSNGGTLITGGYGYIGYNASSGSNVAVVNGADSLWTNGYQLAVGNSSAGNQLIISNGGAVFSGQTLVGVDTNADNNLVLVTGNGSVLSNSSYLYLGLHGSFNRLVVSNGGRVYTAGILNEIGYDSDGVSNVVVVTGAGSRWDAPGQFFMGLASPGNQLIVSNGGVVADQLSLLGVFASASNTTATVTGAGSLWSNSASLTIDSGGTRLLITNGGAVFGGSNTMILGATTNAQRIRVTVDDGTLTVRNAGGTAVYDLRRGTNALNDGLIDVDYLMMTNTAGVFEFNGGTLITRGGFISNGAPFVVGANGSTPAIWDVRDGVSNVVVASNVVIGLNVANSQLLITNGQTLQVLGRDPSTPASGLLGKGASASNTMVLVSGAGSYWSNAFNLHIGGSSVGNRLVITNGGRVTTDIFALLGETSASSNNELVITGIGSTLVSGLSLEVGLLGDSNRLVIADGATAASADGFLSRNGGNGNEAIVTGSSSTWSNQGNLSVGFSGGRNRLVITNGGLVVDLDGQLGRNAGTSNNVAVVTGAGSVWSNRSALYVGYDGSGSQLVITNGGTVFASNAAYLGFDSTSSNNLLTVGGSGLRVANVAGTGIYDIRRGTNVLNAGLIDVDQLVMTNSAGVFTFNGGTLITRGGLISNGAPFIVGANGNTPAIWDVRDGASNVVVASNLVIGLNVPNSQLLITNGQTLHARGGDPSVSVPSSVIGANAAATGSVAVIAGSGSLWSNANDLIIGSNSAFNQLVVSNGGMVRNAIGYVGLSSTASNNVALVTGSDSVWTNASTLNVGLQGAGNQLLVSGGGTVRNVNGFIGNGSASSNNLAVVTGSGSLWSNASSLNVGSGGAWNQLVVSNAGTVKNTIGRIGFGSTSSNNVALVTGSGSLWSSSSDLNVGQSGAGNQLMVSDGGTVQGTGAYLGLDSTSTNNRIINNGGNLIVSNGSTGVFDIRRGTNQFNSGLIYAEQLVMTNAAGLFEFNGGTLITRGGLISNGAQFVVGANGTTPAIWDVRAGVSNVVLISNLFVGSNVAGSQLLITNGQTLQVRANDTMNLTAVLGRETAASNTLAVVSGPGSYWSNQLRVVIGYNSSGNRLVISNGGRVSSDIGYLSYTNSASSNNEVVVTGAGSVWSNNQTVVGYFGSSNRLVISSGGTVVDDFGNLGSLASGTRNNEVVVTGAGSVWTNRSDVLVRGAAGRLVITNGGTVADNVGYLGYDSGSSNNVAFVTGSGSLWRNSSNLLVGLFGSGNALVISDHGAVVNRSGVIGAFAGANNNRVIVSDTMSWTNNGDLFVGDAGSGNQLLLTNAGQGFSWNTYVGNQAGSSNNLLLVADTNSLLGTSTNLFIGVSGSFNQMVISNGGLVTNQFGYIGSNATAFGNTVIVSGAGSLWMNQFDLYVGSSGAGNQLVVSNGGWVRSRAGFLGYDYASSNNQVVVTDAGSGWSNQNALFVGYNGAGNRLVISNGGWVRSLFGFVGGGSASSNNEVVVTGAGSVWSNVGELHMGEQGIGNRLVISNGGTVRNGGDGYIGAGSTSSNNVAVVTGAGSVWSNQSDLYVGGVGTDNRLVISNGGVVSDRSSYVGAISNNNVAVVTGAGSLWTNRFTLNVGQNGAGNQLVVSNGGTVFASNAVTLGVLDTSTNNRIEINGGSLLVSNATGTGVLDVRRGTNQFNSGLIDVDQLVMTNAAGVFEFNGGTLVTRGGLISNGAPFVVGANGTTPAIWDVRAGVSNMVVSNLLVIGQNVAGSGLLVTNGQTLWVPSPSILGSNAASSNNYAIVAGAGSLWSNTLSLFVGNSGAGNQLVVSNGGEVRSGGGFLGVNASSSNNLALVTGLGSLWSIANDLRVGTSGNQLVVSNGGMLRNLAGYLGLGSSSGDNLAVVTGAGSLWSNSFDLYVGNSGARNQLLVSNGGTVVARNGVYLGFNSSSTINRIEVNGGSLLVSNAIGTGVLDVRRGTNSLTAGLVDVDQLLVTNLLGKFDFKGGTLRTRGTLVDNGADFVEGDGASSALFEFVGSLAHAFSNRFVINSNATASLNSGFSGGIAFGQGVQVNWGGTLRYEAPSQLAAGTKVELSGGTFNLNGKAQSATLGALTMSATSTLDFGTGGSQVFTFASLASHTAGSLLHIQNWEGAPSGGGIDQVKFADLGASVTPTFLGDVRFAGYPNGAILLPGTGEIVPVPEPATWVVVVVVFGWLMLLEVRRRLRRS
jgi:T5SS/PEP-CTERM-associated repeat protein